jgi:hypothetical protein
MGIAQFEATLCMVADDSNLDGRGQTGAQGARGQSNTVDPVRVKLKRVLGEFPWDSPAIDAALGDAHP